MGRHCVGSRPLSKSGERESENVVDSGLSGAYHIPSVPDHTASIHVTSLGRT